MYADVNILIDKVILHINKSLRLLEQAKLQIQVIKQLP